MLDAGIQPSLQEFNAPIRPPQRPYLRAARDKKGLSSFGRRAVYRWEWEAIKAEYLVVQGA